MVAFGMFRDVDTAGEHSSYQRDDGEDWRPFHL
jgi:hypothetical protein